MSIARIDQFAPSTAVGDGVTGSLLFTRELLRELGYKSDIYSHDVPAPLRGEVLPLSAFRDDPGTVLLYHHSMGHDHGAWLLARRCPKVIVYHNITPAQFFPADSALRRYALLGRQQLAEWRQAFIAAIAVSPLNQRELQEAGYSDTVTIPLLVDSRRLEGDCAAPHFIERSQQHTYYLCVGRLAENKRQYLLIEALYHLLQLQGSDAPQHPMLLLVGGVTSEDYARGLAHHVEQLGLQQHVLLPGKCSDAELRWLYRNSHQYWCASAHEGFCMPLIEAQHAGLPVIACAQSNIPDTVGEGGLLLQGDDPLAIALAAQLLNESHNLREQLQAASMRNLQRFDREHLKRQLGQWLEHLTQSLAWRAMA